MSYTTVVIILEIELENFVV